MQINFTITCFYFIFVTKTNYFIMKSKAILIALIEHLDAFEHENEQVEELKMNDFLGYLNSKNQSYKVDIRNIRGDQETWMEETHGDNKSDIAILITMLFKYAKVYIKKALKDSLIQTIDEFSYLIILMTYESLTKSELIVKNIMEKTSGTEVIKRLINQDLIFQFADENDKRSTRVAITPKGKNEIMKVLPEMHKVSTLVAGNLSNEEINTLSYLLKKLDLFHNDIFIHQKDIPLDELLVNH